MAAGAERRVENEAIFRAGNAAVRSNVGHRQERAPYFCECGDETCFEHIHLAPDEYASVRHNPARFFLRPGHERVADGDEVVVERQESYVVVEKTGAGRHIAEKSVPREAR
jgi:hypothetical protein